mgnify:FL=1
MVEEEVGVDGASVEAYLEMQVRSCGPSRLSGESDDLTGFYFLALLDEVLRLMAVAGGESVSMPDNDVVAI